MLNAMFKFVVIGQAPAMVEKGTRSNYVYRLKLLIFHWRIYDIRQYDMTQLLIRFDVFDFYLFGLLL